jgi:hypothetical protein
MNNTLDHFKNSKFSKYVKENQKYAPILFFVGGFTFDSLTLGRIDRLYDLSILCVHMTLLTATLYFYNIVDNSNWKDSLLERYKTYIPLAIQFFFGALSSAYVIYYSRSVSLSKTFSFFIILVVLLVANEFMKKRMANKYLLFSIYFFVSFTFFSFIIPVFISKVNTLVFIFSGFVSLGLTLYLIHFIFKKSESLKTEIKLKKMFGIIVVIYLTINSFYFFKLIPPVPLALQEGIVAHDVIRKNSDYVVTYQTDSWYVFWREHRSKYIYRPGENIYVFTSIFAPTDIDKLIYHRWKWYNDATEEWEIIEDIGYDITGGRDMGYRGYTYKGNVKQGDWRVEVITEEELILGVIDFEIIVNDELEPVGLVEKKF